MIAAAEGRLYGQLRKRAHEHLELYESERALRGWMGSASASADGLIVEAPP